MQRYTLLVNSCDGFEDCWDPFFFLLKKNWPDLTCPILLNTEFKDYTSPFFDIKCSKANFGHSHRLTWSQCLMQAIEKVETPLVLYMQEDYFINGLVNNELVNKLAGYLEKNEEIKYIGLTTFGNYGPFQPYKTCEDLCVVSPKSKYRISTQAGLWKKDTLLSYLRETENGWMFEIFGTKRAQNRNDLFLTINRNKYPTIESSAIPYIYKGGIVKGKWQKEVPAFFETNGIKLDFQKRGFYQPKSVWMRKIETLKKLFSNPVSFFKGITGR